MNKNQLTLIVVVIIFVIIIAFAGFFVLHEDKEKYGCYLGNGVDICEEEISDIPCIAIKSYIDFEISYKVNCYHDTLCNEKSMDRRINTTNYISVYSLKEEYLKRCLYGGLK